MFNKVLYLSKTRLSINYYMFLIVINYFIITKFISFFYGFLQYNYG